MQAFRFTGVTKRWLALVTAVYLAGCARLLQPVGEQDGGTVPVDLRIEDRGRETVAVDSAVPQDVAILDTPGDASGDAPADLFAPDASCQPAPTVSTIALFRFEATGGTTMVDDTGQHDGTLVGAGIQRVPGRCGGALQVPTQGEHYGVIPDVTDWDLAVGSIDFWVWFDSQAPGVPRGVLCRDSAGNASEGHLLIRKACGGRLQVRHQVGGVSHYLCSSAPLSDERWYHVAINIGPPTMELLLDGVLQSGVGPISWYVDGTCTTHDDSCATPSPAPIGVNRNPWVVGAACSASDEGQATPIGFALGGKLDSLRISAQRIF